VKIPATMRGVRLTGHGDVDKLELRNDIPLPDIQASDVLIHVAAAGVNNTDINTRTGWYSKSQSDTDDAGWTGDAIQFPRIQGIDVCGRIVAVGADISEDRMGERVLIEPCIREAGGRLLEQPWFLGSECDGGFAEYTAVAARHAYRVESKLTDAELASFPCSYSTAENLLTRTVVRSNDTVLITGASGGVGSAAIQLARARQATVLAITSPSKSAEILKLGAEQTFDRDAPIDEILGHNSVDVVIDLVAGNQFPRLLNVLRPGGRYGVAGAIGGPLVELDVRTVYLKDLSMFGCTALDPDVFANLIRHIEGETVSPLVAETYPLEQIVDAQTAFITKNHVGKIVLTVATDT